MIVGITGTIGAGKGTVVKYLVQKGFIHYSVRNFLIEEINRRGMPVNRESMRVVANDLRAKNGSDYIVVELYKRAKENGGNAIIESVRAVGEVESLRKLEDFVLLSVDAPVEVRYERIVARGGETDNRSLEEFKEDERLESESDDPSKQNLPKCIALADHKIVNDSSVEDLRDRINGIIDKSLRKAKKDL